MKTLSVMVTKHEMEEIKTTSEIFANGNTEAINRFLNCIMEDGVITLAYSAEDSLAPMVCMGLKERKDKGNLITAGTITCSDELYDRLPFYINLMTGEEHTGEVLADLVAGTLAYRAHKHRANLDKQYGFKNADGEFADLATKNKAHAKFEMAEKELQPKNFEASYKLQQEMHKARKKFIFENVEDEAPFIYVVNEDTVDWQYIKEQINAINIWFDYKKEVTNQQLFKDYWNEITLRAKQHSKFPG